MHFSLSTIATTALIIAAVESFPHRPYGTGISGHHSGRPQGTGVPSAFPTGATFGARSEGHNSTGGHGKGQGGKGRFSRLPSGGFSSNLPTDLPSSALPTAVSSISSELPGTLNVVIAAAKSTKTSTKTKTSKSTKTSTASEATATGSDDDSSDEPAATSAVATGDDSSDEPAATSAVASGDDSSEPAATSAAASVPADDGEASSKTSVAASEPTGSTSGSTAATTTFPTAAGESTLSEPMVVTGEFDGGMVRFGRGVSCTGQSEGGDDDAVFQVEEGGTLKNVIIGADQSEGVHCMGACTIENVWWEAVCEDALTIKQTAGTSYVIGGGAKGASDKVFQHNGAGTLNVKGFYASDFGKLYRSCGNCDSQYERHVIMDGVIADGGSATLVGINPNYGDTATITNSCITNTDPVCTEFEGNDTGAEPSEVSSGISASCVYTAADIAAC